MVRPKMSRHAFTHARRLLRSSTLRWSSIVTLVVSTGLTSLYLILLSLTLTPQMVLEEDFGRYQAFVGFGSVPIPAGDSASGRAIEKGLDRIGIDEGLLTLSIVGAQFRDEGVTLREGPWQAHPFPGRYDLNQGRWPSGPNEAVVATSSLVDAEARLGQEVELFSGGIQLRIVGVADDRYGGRNRTLLLGEGTWARLSPDRLARFAGVDAYPVVFWDDTHATQVVDLMVDVLVPLKPGTDRKTLRADVESTMGRAADTVGDSPRPWMDDNPAGYAFPSLGLPTLAFLAAVGCSAGAIGRWRDQFTAMGASRARALVTCQIAAAGVNLLAAAVGWFLGWALAWVVRPGVQRLHDQPLAPYVLPVDPLSRTMVGLLVGVVLASLVSFLRGPRIQSRLDAPEGRVADLRHYGAAALACVIIVLVPRLETPQQAMLLAALVTGTGIMLLPEFATLAHRLLGGRSPAAALARRQLQAANARSTAAMALVTAVLSASIGFVTLFSTIMATADETQEPDVLPGQILVADRATPVVPPPRPTLDLVRRATASMDVQEVRLRFVASGSPDEPGRREASLVGDNGLLMCVDSSEDAAVLLGEALPAEYAGILESGGVIRWDEELREDETQSGSATIVLSGSPFEHRAESLVTRTPNVGWSHGKTGLMLASTARSLGLPVSDGAVLLAPLSSAEAADVRAEVATSGLDPRVVQTYADPPPTIPPVGLSVSALGLMLLAAAVVVGESRGRVAQLRVTLVKAMAIGASRRWVHGVMLRQQFFVVGVATLVGLVTGVLPVVLAGQLMNGRWVLDVPWLQIAALLGATYLGVTIATWLGIRRLTAG